MVTWFVKETSGKALRGSLPVVEEHQEIKEILENPEEALWWQEEARQIHEKKEELTEQP
ncbi:hypothetical protein D3C83_105360 [compost metagenome]